MIHRLPNKEAIYMNHRLSFASMQNMAEEGLTGGERSSWFAYQQQAFIDYHERSESYASKRVHSKRAAY